MRRFAATLLAVALGFAPVQHIANAHQPGLGQLLSAPIQTERSGPVSDIPLTLESGKIYLDATVNDQAGEFIFDTGSPTILDQSFANSLNLEIIGHNQGRDANGNVVSMKIAVAETIRLGDVTFRDVPVMIHDFSEVPLGQCYLRQGVIGSELLPGSAWRIDMAGKSLKIASDVRALPLLKGSKRAKLHLFGYPFAPIVNYSIGRFSDKALFDTGNSAELALFDQIMSDKSVRKKIDRSSIRSGQGQHGTSAGGVGETLPLKSFNIQDLKIGEYSFQRSAAQSRPVPPSLIGAGILKSHIVTLDYPNAEFHISPSANPLPSKQKAGFALSVRDNHVEVTQLFDASEAKTAGVLLGDEVLEIDGSKLATSSEADRCQTSLWLSNAFDAKTVKSLRVKRGEEIMDILF